MRARLLPVSDGHPIELAKDMTVIGRDDECDIQLNHKSVSSLHCILVKTDGLILVRDLGSTNGTRVNGQRVRRAALLPNDHLSIATFRYRVKFGEDTVEAAPLADPAKAEELDNLLAAADDEPGESVKEGGPPLKRNALPDTYPEKGKKAE